MQIVTVSLFDLEQLLEQKALKIIKAISERKESQSTHNEWLNLSQLCCYLPDKPSKATVYGWVNKKTIPYHKTTKALRFLRSEIDSWLMEGRKPTNAEVAKNISEETDSYLITRRNKKCR